MATTNKNEVSIEGDNNLVIQNNHGTIYYGNTQEEIRRLIREQGEQISEIHQVLLSHKSKTYTQYANKIFNIAKADNVKILDFNGAEVIHTKNVFIYNILSLRSLLLVLAVVFLGVCGYVYSPDIKHYFSFDKIFSKNDKKFKILVLPFQKFGNTNIAVGETIQKKLQEINMKDTLNIDVRYLSNDKHFDFSNEKAEEFMYYHDADFVIYGGYEDKERTKDGKDNFSINYQIHRKYFPLFTLKQPIDEKTIKNLDFAKNFQSGYLEDIRNGKLIGNIEYIVNYISALTDYAGKKYQKAQRKCEKIIMDLGYETYDVWNLMGHLCLDMDKNNFALVSFIKATYLDSTRMENYFNRGVCFLRLGLYEAAKDDFTQAMVDSTIAPQAYLKRAMVYTHLNQYEEAFRDTDVEIKNKDENLESERHFIISFLLKGLIGISFETYEASLICFKSVLGYKDSLQYHINRTISTPLERRHLEREFNYILTDTTYINIAKELMRITEKLNDKRKNIYKLYDKKLTKNPKDSFNLLVQTAKKLEESGFSHSAVRVYKNTRKHRKDKYLFCSDKIIDILLKINPSEAGYIMADVLDNYEYEKLNSEDRLIFKRVENLNDSLMRLIVPHGVRKFVMVALNAYVSTTKLKDMDSETIELLLQKMKESEISIFGESPLRKFGAE